LLCQLAAKLNLNDRSDSDRMNDTTDSSTSPVLRLLVIPSGSCLGRHSRVAIFQFELKHDVRIGAETPVLE